MAVSMTPERAAQQMRELGLDPADERGKRELFGVTLQRFRTLTGASPEHVFWIPGRLEVFGKHTDYGGGRTLVSAVPRGFALTVSPRGDGKVQVADALRDESFVLDAKGVEELPAAGGVRTGGWRNYVQTVVRRLGRNFPGLAAGADMVFASDLPRASGMSSSSALMIAVAAGIGRVAGIATRAEWLQNIRTPLDAAAYFACIENGSRFGSLEGDEGVGTHGGSEDHAAIVTGKPSSMSAFAFVPPRHLEDVALPDAWRFVLTPSGVAADKTGGAKGPYNRLAAAAGALLQLWNASHVPAVSLAAALATSPDAFEQLREMAEASHLEGWPAEALTRRLDHFVREDARIPLAVDAFRRADPSAIHQLSVESQVDAEVLLRNQVEETVTLANAAHPLGAIAASSFGAGFGGSVWALVDSDLAPEFAARWHPHAFIARPAPPLSEL
jgi:galactokinase